MTSKPIQAETVLIERSEYVEGEDRQVRPASYGPVRLGDEFREWKRRCIQALKDGNFRPGAGYGVYPDLPYDYLCIKCGKPGPYAGSCAACYMETPLRKPARSKS